ncbi:MAG: DUF58 domain-containing protein [Thermoplasmata archaeon]
MTAAEGAEEPLRWRRTTYGLFATTAILFAIGIIYKNPVPLFLGLPFLLTPISAALSQPKGVPTAQLTWSADGIEGEIHITGRLTPGPNAPAGEIIPEFMRPASLSERRPPDVRYDTSGISFDLAWETSRPCLARVPVPRISWRDPIGLVERPGHVEGTPLSIERYPPELMRIGSPPLRRTILVPGEVRSRATGRSGDFFAIRDAAPTDTPRQINWRATARRGRMLANEYYLERTGDVLLLLDLRPSPLGPERDSQLSSLTAAAAYGIAEAFLDEKARVGLAFYDEFVTALPLASGRTQRYRIREALRHARPGRSGGPEERCAIALRRYFPAGVMTILLSPLADEAAANLIPHLRLRGFPVIVLSPSPLPIILDRTNRRSPVDPIADRLMRLVRRGRVGEVWEDAPVVDWDNYWSLTGFVDLMSAPVRHRGIR